MLAPDMVLDDAGPVDIDPDAEVLLTPVPPDESFWKKHSSHLEFPQSLLVSTFLVACMFGLVVACLYLALGPGPTKPVPPISLAGGGDDDAGLGSPDAGLKGGQGGTAPLAPTTMDLTPSTPTPDVATPPLPPVKNPTTPAESVDTAPGSLPTPSSSFDGAIAGTQIKIASGTPGDGPGQGRDGPGTQGGPHGTGADATRARSLRWVIKFTTSGGQDYLDQLAALNAIVLVPVPAKQGQYYLFTDLKRPNFGPLASDSDMVRFGGQVQFRDDKPDSVKGVAAALKLPFAPSEFYAVFPAGIETKLADLEKAYQNRRPEQIAETRFQVTVTNGSYVFVVVGQTAK